MKTNKRVLQLLGVFYSFLFLSLVFFYISNPFENKCIKGDCEKGLGEILFSSGMKYEGEWKNGKRDGHGTLTYPNAYIYVGEWKNNKMHGNGVKTSDHGWKYEGEWKNGHQDGIGTLTTPVGYKYKGEWKMGLRHGQATEFFPNRHTYIGNWKNDKIHGYGVMTSPNDYVLEGEWRNGSLYDGRKTLIYADGKRLELEWKNGKNAFSGIVIFPDGRKTKIESEELNRMYAEFFSFLIRK